MAKKKAKAATAVGAKQGSPGRKACPECGESVGPRTVQCRCGHKFRVSSKKAKGGGQVQAKEAIEQLREAQALAELLGENGEDILDKIDRFGGVAEAREWVKFAAEMKPKG